jgi:hypothetical protein
MYRYPAQVRVMLTATLVGLVVGMSACGKAKQRVDIQDASSVSSTDTLTVNDPNCKKSACPKVDFSIVNGSGKDLTTESFSGSMGVPVDWKLRVKSDATPGRVRIVILQAPLWLKSKPADIPGGVDIVEVPDEVATNASFVVLGRDISRCKALEKVTKSCTDTKTSYKEYDTLFNIRFSITGN